MRALLDTNVVLDILLQRETFYNDAVNVFKQITANKLSAYISATTATDIFYFLKKEKTDAVTILKNLLEIVDVLGVDKTIVIAALYSAQDGQILKMLFKHKLQPKIK